MNDERLIRDVQRKWFEATNQGDAETLADLMTEDVVFLTPGKEPFGRREFLDSFLLMKEHVTIDCKGEYKEVLVDGNWGCTTAFLEIEVLPKNGGNSKHLSGHALSVFRRSPDGKWRLARDANMLTPRST